MLSANIQIVLVFLFGSSLTFFIICLLYQFLQRMFQWLQLTICLLLSATVSGAELECDDFGFLYVCWDSTSHGFSICSGCEIKNQQITDNDVTIAPKNRDGTAADVEIVEFSGGDVTKMPKIINENNNKQMLHVKLYGTKTGVLNAQFFGNSAQHLIHFWSSENYNLTVEASAFQNFAELEFLDLSSNGISSISPDAFRGLNKLIYLDLHDNNLTAINENWFDDLANLERLDLGANQLVEVADTAFKNLPKLMGLHLGSNIIEIVRRRMFHNNQQLETIDLEYNQIKEIESGSFAHLDKLSRLVLSGNKCINRDFYDSNPAELWTALVVCHPIESIEGQLKFPPTQIYLL